MSLNSYVEKNPAVLLVHSTQMDRIVYFQRQKKLLSKVFFVEQLARKMLSNIFSTHKKHTFHFFIYPFLPIKSYSSTIRMNILHIIDKTDRLNYQSYSLTWTSDQISFFVVYAYRTKLYMICSCCGINYEGEQAIQRPS